MKLTNLTIRDLLTPDAKLTFLIGAGCSRDEPSCLPMGGEMMKAIISYTCAESEIEKITNLDQLRFEALVEIIRDVLDNDLKLIDFYGLCNKPNLQHFFLAEMIKKGNFLITTNFDFLIEYALQQSGVPKEEIRVVITKNDFKKLSNPQELYSEGLKALYKIHGSTKNVVTGVPTRDSLIATIRAFGANKEGKNVFQLEPFKQPSFTNVTQHRSLVIMGYSGNDDFDVVPTLKVLKNLQNLIWINYSPQVDMGTEKIYEINATTILSLDKVDENSRKITELLYDIWRNKNTEHIYLVNINTSKMVRDLLDFEPEYSSINFAAELTDWFINNIKITSKILKYYIAFKIYFNHDFFNDALRCSEEMLNIAEQIGDLNWQSLALSNIGIIYNKMGNLSEALDWYEKSFQVEMQIGKNFGSIATSLNNIGQIYLTEGEFDEAFERFERALKIAEHLVESSVESKHLKLNAVCLNNIGAFYQKKANYDEAIIWYRKALKIAEKSGDLSLKSLNLLNLGGAYRAQGNYQKALNLYEEALEINQKLGKLMEASNTLASMGRIYETLGNYPEALKRFKNALQINEKIGFLRGKVTDLSDIGRIYYMQKNIYKALNYFENGLKISEQLGNLNSMARFLNNIGNIYQDQKKYPETVKYYERALEIAEQLENLKDKALMLNNIGNIYLEQGNYPEALKLFNEGLKTVENVETKDFQLLTFKAGLLLSAGAVLMNQENYNSAIQAIEESVEIYEQLGRPVEKARGLCWLGRIYSNINNPSKAIKYLEDGVAIYKKHGLINEAQAVQKGIADLRGTTEAKENPLEQIKELNKIGKIYQTQGNHWEALRYYKDALKALEQMDGDWEVLLVKASTLNNIAMINTTQKNFQKALEYFDRVLKINEQLGDIKGKATVLNNIATNLYMQENYEEALKVFKESLDIIEQFGDSPDKARCLLWIGNTCRELKDISKAIEYMTKGHKILISLGMTSYANTIQKDIKNLKKMVDI